MVGLVDDNHVPRTRREHFVPAALPSREVRAGKQDRERPPRVPGRRDDRVVVDVHEAAAIEPWDTQGELLGELLLPLLHHRGRDEQQDTRRLAAHEQLADDEPDLDGLAEADLVREEVRARIGLDRSPRSRDLVGPRRHAGGREADLSASVETRGNRDELQLRILGRWAGSGFGALLGVDCGRGARAART